MELTANSNGDLVKTSSYRLLLLDLSLISIGEGFLSRFSLGFC
jgi:hypothetical protein